MTRQLISNTWPHAAVPEVETVQGLAVQLIRVVRPLGEIGTDAVVSVRPPPFLLAHTDKHALKHRCGQIIGVGLGLVEADGDHHAAARRVPEE